MKLFILLRTDNVGSDSGRRPLSDRHYLGAIKSKTLFISERHYNKNSKILNIPKDIKVTNMPAIITPKET